METTTLQARIDNPAFLVPGALEALQSLHKGIQRTGLDPKLLELMNLRASQINGCGVCVAAAPEDRPQAGRDRRPPAGGERAGATRRSSPTPSGRRWR